MHDDNSDWLWCPKCGGEVHEFAQKCHHCGDWMTPTLREPHRGGLRWLFKLVVVGLLIYAFLRLIMPW